MQNVLSTTIEVDLYWQNETFTFNKEIMKDIDLDLYPSQRLHFLIDSLIKNNKPPSQKTMTRSEQRNRRNQKTSNQRDRNPRTGNEQQEKFELPNKYGKKPPQRTNRRNQRRRFNDPNQEVPLTQPTSLTQTNQKVQKQTSETSEKSLPKGFCFSQLIHPQFIVSSPSIPNRKNQSKSVEQSKIKLPAELVRKKKEKLKPTVSNTTSFKVHSPEWIELKAKKQQISQTIETLRQPSELRPNPIKEVPLYFQKKKENQKRRRQEKHNLIVKNRAALLQIFGDAIFKKGWPVSRKQIRQALGLPQSQELDYLKFELDILHQQDDVSIQ